jgi:xanthine dehydrogenase molybdopterin-binding subunit B
VAAPTLTQQKGRVTAIYPDGSVDVDYDGGNMENHLNAALVRLQALSARTKLAVRSAV